MEEYIPLAVALGVGFVAWKVFAGVVKFLLIAAVLCGAAYYVMWAGLI